MKVKVTKKMINENYVVQRLGYGEAQDLERLFREEYYTSGIYGWNADVYTIDNIAIATGYRPFGERYLSSEEVQEWNKKAKELRCLEEEEYLLKVEELKKALRKAIIEKYRAC